jgi:DNA-binding NarL/FixJ family response regulator
LKSVLVIDDDAAYRKSIGLILQLEGFYVRTADNGATGLELVREKRPDLILCDIMMPGMDGHSVLKQLKNDSSITDIPFIFVSALGDRSDIRRGMSEGSDDYLSKPFTAGELVAAVVSRLNRIEVFRRSAETEGYEREVAILRNSITSREREILILVGQGATSKEIAQNLKIRPNTVEVHRANLMKKLNAPNAANLARWAFIANVMQSPRK